MKFTFSKRFKNLLASASVFALASGFLGFAAAPAYANTRSPITSTDTDNSQSDGGLRPGQWRRLSENNMGDSRILSLEALTLAETKASQDLGRPVVFYKVIMPDGVYTNLEDSQTRGPNVNHTYMFSRGLLDPVRNVRDLNDDYDFRVSDFDRSLMPYVLSSHQQIVAMATNRPRVQTASAVPVPVARPTVVARNIPFPTPRPPQSEIDAASAPVAVAAADTAVQDHIDRVFAPADKPANVEPAPVVVAEVDSAAVPVVTQSALAPVEVASAASDDAAAQARIDRVFEPAIKAETPATDLAVAEAAPAPVAVTKPAPVAIAPTLLAQNKVRDLPIHYPRAFTPADSDTVKPHVVQTASIVRVADRDTVVANARPVVQTAALSVPVRAPMVAKTGLTLAERFAAQTALVPNVSVPVATNVPTKKQRSDQMRDQFAIAQNNDMRLHDGGAPVREWVTPSGQSVEFEMFENGRFRVAKPPQYMAA